MKGSKLLSMAAGLAGLAAAANAHALAWYFQSPGSQLAREIDQLHQYVMWLIIVIFIVVFGVMFWACYAHRKSKGHAAEQFHENTTVELLWTVIPAIILVVIAWPVTKVVIAQKDTSAPDITVKVTGYQWKWGYDYIKGEGEGIGFVKEKNCVGMFRFLEDSCEIFFRFADVLIDDCREVKAIQIHLQRRSQ